MVKKKSSSNAGSNKGGKDGKPENKSGENGKPGNKSGRIGKAEAEHERISQLVLVTRRRRDTWDVLRKRLESHQATQKKETNIEQDHYNYYTLEADHAAKVQAYKDALSQDKSGKKGPTKSAKKARDLAQKAYKKAGRNNRFDKVKRRAEHDSMMTAQAELEDWLYYQDISKRRRRLRLLDPKQRKAVEKEQFDRRIGYKRETSGNDNGHFDWVHSLLEMYDLRDIGGKDYKQGRHDHLGNHVEGRQEEATLPVVGPGELHLWTPNYRRQLAGLRPSRLSDDDGSDDDDEDVRQDLEPHHFKLDNAAIEEKRAAIEKQSDTETQGLEFNTHEARRRHEVARYKDDRPDTSGDRVINTSNGVVVENRWGQIRTEQGLFVSAKESSWDWRTSYDCLGPVMSGWFPETSAIRDEVLEELINPDDNLEYTDGDNGGGISAPQVPAKRAEEILVKARNERAKKRGDVREPVAESITAEEPANDKAGSTDPGDESRNIQAKIDNRYPPEEIGVRVPYEPMTIEDLRLRKDDQDETNIDATASLTREAQPGKGARDEHMGTGGYNELSNAPSSFVVVGNKRRELGTVLAKDANRRALYEVRSMAVPIINTPQELWASLSDSSGDDSGEDGGESDNEGDLFFRSYEDECFPNGRDAPSVSPVTGEESEDL
ncbi:unnamed protein product [Alternaria alternata]